eukprot:1522589-Rhodomonas_salina.1
MDLAVVESGLVSCGEAGRCRVGGEGGAHWFAWVGLVWVALFLAGLVALGVAVVKAVVQAA